jgi:hypothetical protein
LAAWGCACTCQVSSCNSSLQGKTHSGADLLLSPGLPAAASRLPQLQLDGRYTGQPDCNLIKTRHIKMTSLLHAMSPCKAAGMTLQCVVSPTLACCLLPQVPRRPHPSGSRWQGWSTRARSGCTSHRGCLKERSGFQQCTGITHHCSCRRYEIASVYS